MEMLRALVEESEEFEDGTGKPQDLVLERGPLKTLSSYKSPGGAITSSSRVEE